jgi:hypothetical protein
MSAEVVTPATTAYKLGQAFTYLKKAQKLLDELRVSTPTVRQELIGLQEFCNEKVLELKENS